MAQSEFLFLDEPELSLSVAVQHLAIIKPREEGGGGGLWRIHFLHGALQKQLKAVSFVSVAPPSLECH